MVKPQTMKVLLSCLLLTSLAVSTVLGSHITDSFKPGSTLICAEGRKFIVAGSIFTDIHDHVYIRGVNEKTEENKSSGSGVKATGTTTSESSKSGSHSNETNHKSCYSVPTLHEVKIARKEKIEAEVKFLKAFGPQKDFPEFIGQGTLPNSNGIALEFYVVTRNGRKLEAVFRELKRKLSVGNTLGVGAHMMDHFEVLHSHKPHPYVWRKFDISNIRLAGKHGQKHKVYPTGFESIMEYVHGTGTSRTETVEHSPANDIQCLAYTLIYLSKGSNIPVASIDEMKKLKGINLTTKLVELIGQEHGHALCSFIEAVYGLKPNSPIDHNYLKGLLLQQAHSWDWEHKE